MGLVKYTRYPEETGHGIKIMQGGADYPGVDYTGKPGHLRYQSQGAECPSTTLRVFKLQVDNHLFSTQIHSLQTH